MSGAPVLEARGLVKKYGNVTAINGADFELREGEVLAVIGDNGAGKTSLIKALAGAVVPDSGEILMNGKPVSFKNTRDARAAGIETVYQDLAVVQALDIASNLYLGREVRRKGLAGNLFRRLDMPRMREEAAQHLADLKIGIKSVNQAVETLSGGQRQGVAVARAAAFGRGVIIMDEPTAALGVRESGQVIDLIRSIRDRGIPVVLISHDMPHVFEVADRIHIHRLGQRAGVVDPKTRSMSEVVALMTGAEEPTDEERAVTERSPVGIFVGLATLDVIHRIAKAPAVNEKVTSTAQFVAAGGPAANAAITFAALGGDAILVTALGDGPVADVIRADLAAYRVRVVDAAAGTTRAVPVSAVSVVESTGDRSVVSLDAVNSDASPPEGLADLVAAADVVLVDGHHPLIARAAAQAAAARAATVVVDAGRWKPGMDHVIPHATDMVCSNDFRTPGAEDSASAAAALVRSGVHTVVTTHGGEPVEWWSDGQSGSVPVEAVVVVDTLGAGDAFHGAYSYFTVQTGDVAERVYRSARVAALRCSVIGPRAWLSELPSLEGRKRER